MGFVNDRQRKAVMAKMNQGGNVSPSKYQSGMGSNTLGDNSENKDECTEKETGDNTKSEKGFWWRKKDND